MTSTEEVNRRTDNVYKAISEQFNPNLKTFLLAARSYEKALTGVTNASRHYFDAMNKLGIIAGDCTSSKQLGESMQQISEALRQIHLHHDETTAFLREEVITPLENKLENDQKYINGAYRSYQMDFKLKVEDLERAEAHHEKVKRKSYSGRKSYKYDDKEKELSEEIGKKQKALKQFQYDNLKHAFIEERRRYCFFVEQQTDYIRRSIAYHQKALDSLTGPIPKWVETCADMRAMPDNAALLLDQLKADDTHSISSIPEPPNTPAGQANDNQNMYRAAYSSFPSNGVSNPTVEASGHNPIPRDNRKRVAAQHSHNVPGSPTQLSFEKGDIIVLMIPQPRDGWHFGENDRTRMRGWFPYSYTKLVEKQDRPQELIHGHMPLPPADYNSTGPNETGRNMHPENGQDPYKSMKDQFFQGNPFANVHLRKTPSGI